MKKILKYVLLGVLISFAYNCEEDLESGATNYVTFYNEGDASVLRIANNATATKEVKVYTGNKTGSDRTFNVMVAPNSTLQTNYSVPATVTVPANTNEGTLLVSVTDDDNLQFVPQTLVLVLEDEAGFSTGETLVLNVTELCPDTIVKFSLKLDTWPDETTWEIYDLSGGQQVVIASGGPYVNPDDDFAEFVFEYCLASGNYGVVVYDAYGDGGPNYKIALNGVTVVSETVTGTFTSSEFTVN